MAALLLSLLSATGFGPQPAAQGGLYGVGDVVDIEGKNVTFSKYKGYTHLNCPLTCVLSSVVAL